MDNAIPRTPQTPRTPTVAEVRARVQANARNAPRRPVDRSYTREIENYKRWVERQRLIRDGKYITRDNIDLYFTETQQTRLVKANTGRRVVAALQVYANDEYAGAEEKFVVDSPTVTAMLLAQKQRKRQQELAVSKDYHVNLSVKNMTYNEKRQIVRSVLQTNKPFWSDFLTAWNACNSMFCRVDTIRKIKLNDIYIDNNHSPGSLRQDPTWEFDNKMLCLILRPLIHKERFENPRVIGVYRHKDPFMCFTGSLAMNIFVCLNQQFPNIVFNDSDENIINNIRTQDDRDQSDNYVEPQWSQIDLIRGWANHNAAQRAYTQVLQENNISWEKVTHLRKSGIESAAASGLDAQSIGTMSKHQTERGTSKMSTVYFTELFPPVLLWASGYDKNDIYSYNNPRTRLRLPIANNDNNINDNDAITLAIFPRYLDWKRQQQHVAGGDNRLCANHFIFEVLPFIATTVIQDGIFWIHEYPDSLPSRLLQERMRPIFPDFTRWAQQARRDIQEQGRAVGRVQVDTLNQAAQQAFNMMVSKMEQQVHEQQQNHQYHEQQHQALRQLLHQQQQQHQQQLQLIQQHLQQVQEQQQLLIQQLVRLQPNNINIVDGGNNNEFNGIDGNDGDHDIDVNGNDGNDDNINGIGDNMVLVPPIANAPLRPIYNMDAIVVPVEPRMNVNNALQNAPIVPPIPTQLPQSLQQLVQQHFEHRLQNFNNSCKAHWPSNIRQAFSKRKYLFSYIEDRAVRLRGPETIQAKMMLVALRLDQTERAGQSVDKFMTTLRNADPNRRHRRPRRQPDPQQQQ